jgi:hypothetical protein
MYGETVYKVHWADPQIVIFFPETRRLGHWNALD